MKNQIVDISGNVINLRFVKKIIIERKVIIFEMKCDCTKPLLVSCLITNYEYTSITNLLHVLFQHGGITHDC